MPDEPSGGAGWLHRKLSIIVIVVLVGTPKVSALVLGREANNGSAIYENEDSTPIEWTTDSMDCHAHL
jgi:hypothetical protein